VPRLVAEQITDRAAFREELSALALRPNIPELAVRTRAAAALVAVQSPVAADLWAQVMAPLHRGTWSVEVDEAG
jgi:hypothetical protein